MLTLISTHHEEQNKNQTVHGHMAIVKDYVAFPVLDNGSIPLALSALLMNEEQIYQAVEKVDNVIIFGGYDVDPLRYGQEVFYSNIQRYQYRDENEILLVKACIALKKPLLGICRGAQLINVALGGTLYQSIKDNPGIQVVHMQHIHDDHQLSHHITIQHDSFLYDVFGGVQGTVNSFHNQAVERPGDGLRIVAHSQTDGIVEGFQHESLPIYGVQRHPEVSYHFDHYSKKLFSRFL